MLRNYISATILLLANFVICIQPTVADQRVESIIPAIFESQYEAEEYVNGLFAGGSKMIYNVSNTDVMVIYVFGSGVPTRAIGAYVQDDGSWKRTKEMYPSLIGKVTERYRTYVDDNVLKVVGEETRNEWVVFSADDDHR